jgi:Ca2+-binding RTX toxin-like protein
LDDTILGTAFGDRLRGYAGNDSIDGRDGLDMVDYGTNSSSQGISVNLVAQRASDGRSGTDTLISIENVLGGAGNDTIIGGNGDVREVAIALVQFGFITSAQEATVNVVAIHVLLHFDIW